MKYNAPEMSSYMSNTGEWLYLSLSPLIPLLTFLAGLWVFAPAKASLKDYRLGHSSSSKAINEIALEMGGLLLCAMSRR
jgi:hypothetical protein